MLGIFYSITSLFAQENTEKKYWYTSLDSEGYISIQKIKDVDNTSLNTEVKTTLNNKILNFSVSTTNTTDKMVAPLKIVFDGNIDNNLKPVHFTGTRIKKNKKNVSYWTFDGDFTDEMETDPDVKRFTYAKYSATLRIPDRTIPSFNLWAIIPNLPFDKKGTFKFNSLDETKLYVKKNQTVNYLGYTKVTINGEIMKLHKFVHQGKDIEASYFWVNEARELIQVLLDNKFTFRISTKEIALQNKAVTVSK